MANEMKEKALQVKQDMDKLFDAGKQSVLSNSKYIEKSASGKVIRIDDVSEVYHNVIVKADTETEVKVYGKNLFNNDTSLLKEVTYPTTSGTSATRVGYEPYILPPGAYTFTLREIGTKVSKYIYGVICDKEGNYVKSCHLIAATSNKTPLTITVNEGDKIYIYNGNISLNVSNAVEAFEEVQIQLEVGTTATPYEPYKAPQTITAIPTGTEVSSICPDMTFIADTDVTVDYFGSYGMAEKELAMWNGFTNNNTRTFFSYAFYGTDFSAYDSLPDGITIKPTQNSNYMFYSYQGTRLPDGFDLSELPLAYSVYLFGNSPKLEKVQDFGLTARKDYTKYFFYNKMLKEIVILRVSEDSKFDSTFQGCESLEKIIFSGTIASDINLQWSTKLDLESLVSLFNCLKNFLADDPDNAHTKTITLSAESWALLDEYVCENGYNDYTSAQDVVLNVLGWNVA